jgi:hypothetical protein
MAKKYIIDMENQGLKGILASRKPMKKFLDLEIGLGALGALQGCSGKNITGSGGESKYNEGDQVCYTLNGTNYPVTLLENVDDDQMTALVKFEDGKRTSVAVDWLSDIANCMRGDDD